MRISYNDIAPHVPEHIGQVRVNHDNCPAGHDTRARLYIKRDDKAVLAYCHNCGGHHVKSLHKKTRHHDIIKRLLSEQETQETTVKEVKLPEDTELNPDRWPVEARAWLYGHHINDKNITDYSIGYSPSWGRVILPVYESGKLVFWQGRNIDGAGPKYLSVKGAVKPLFIAPGNEGSCVIITEDMLSAIRINLIAPHITGMSLLGTHDRDDLPERLPQHYVMVWLDNDVAGRTKAPELAQRLSLCLRKEQAVYRFRANLQQPKNYSPADLYHILHDGKNYDRVR